MDDLETKSIEELEQMLANPSAIEADAVEPEPVEVEEPAEPESEPAAVEEPPDEPVEATSDEPTEQEASPDSDEPATEELSIEDQIRKTLIDEAEARAKHFESVAGRNAGELGFVKKQLTELQRALQAATQAAPATDQEDPYAQPPPTPQPQPPSTPDHISKWAVQQAVRNAASEFYSAHEDISDLSSDMSKYLTDKQYDASALLESNDPSYAGQETARALDEAYWHARGQHQARVRTQLEEKRADQVRNLQDAKLRGGPTQSGATPTPKPVAKTLDELSVDELREELERLSQ